MSPLKFCKSLLFIDATVAVCVEVLPVIVSDPENVPSRPVTLITPAVPAELVFANETNLAFAQLVPPEIISSAENVPDLPVTVNLVVMSYTVELA